MLESLSSCMVRATVAETLAETGCCNTPTPMTATTAIAVDVVKVHKI